MSPPEELVIQCSLFNYFKPNSQWDVLLLLHLLVLQFLTSSAVSSSSSYRIDLLLVVCRHEDTSHQLLIDQLFEREAQPMKQLFTEQSSGPLYPPSGFQVSFLSFKYWFDG